MRNHEYWVKKDQKKVIARQHTDEMATNYAAEITDCINRTKLYDFTNVAATKGGRIPVCEVLGLDSVSGIFAAKNRTTVNEAYSRTKHHKMLRIKFRKL